MNMRDKIIQDLLAKQDAKYQEFHGKLCPGLNNIIGIRVPELRRTAKEILKSDFRAFLNETKDEYYEETTLEGLVIAGAKISWTEKSELLRKFVPKINNWATCDVVCSSFKLKDVELPEVWNFILQYQKSKREYEVRFIIVMMMDYFLRDEYIKQVLDIINNIHTDQYYVNMASAWLISVAFVKYRDATLEFLKKNNLISWVQNKAIQKIRESYRVSKEDKEYLLQYKK